METTIGSFSNNRKSADVAMWKVSISTSQPRELNNNEKFTILRLRNVSRKECRTIVFGVGIGPLISIIFS